MKIAILVGSYSPLPLYEPEGCCRLISLLQPLRVDPGDGFEQNKLDVMGR